MADAVAFDVIGTLFSLERLRERLREHGAPPVVLELWFAEALRDFFGVSHSGAYIPLAQVLEESLPRTLSTFDLKADDDLVSDVMSTMKHLEPSSGAADAVAMLRDAGCTLLAVTNGSDGLTRRLLDRAGLAEDFSTIISCDGLGTSKPDPAVYRAAVTAAGGPLWLVAAHGWDIAGAARVGLRTAWISSKEGIYPSVYPPPDVEAPDLASAASQILDAAT